LISATLLTLVVLPALYARFSRDEDSAGAAAVPRLDQHRGQDGEYEDRDEGHGDLVWRRSQRPAKLG
jgi:hypothetical protein